MKIITTGETKYSNCCGMSKPAYSNCCGHSSLDGTSGSDDIRSFQKYALSKGARNTTGKKAGEPLSVDGVWGSNTAFAWGLYGKQWEAMQPKAEQSISKMLSDNAKVSAEPTKEEWEKAHPKPATKFLDKVKALPLPAKIGIGVGATVLIGFIIWKLIPKK